VKRSDINLLVREAGEAFERAGWRLPPHPRWDVTDFGLGDWTIHGLVLVNLAEEPEYCEKLMYARPGMTTPAHWHKVKKEDIICRCGELEMVVGAPERESSIKINGEVQSVHGVIKLVLSAGHRVTLPPGVLHEFTPLSSGCVIGEVSTANNDAADNFFLNSDIGRFPTIQEDEPAVVRLVSDV
jgi:D-lyxose ketol-isomerase